MTALQKCPYIVKLTGICTKPAGLLMEFCEKGSLRDFLNLDNIGDYLNWKMRIKLCWDIAKALEFMHKINPSIIHRDMKSYNILMVTDDPDAPVCAKVSDFGTCVATTTFMGRAVDNPIWLAPEIMKGWEYTTKADIYSYAMILYEIYSTEYPYDDYDHQNMPGVKFERFIIEGLRPPIEIATCPRQFEELIRSSWDGNPDQRPSAAEIVKLLEDMREELSEYPFDWKDTGSLDERVQSMSDSAIKFHPKKSFSAAKDYYNKSAGAIPDATRKRTTDRLRFSNTQEKSMSMDSLHLVERVKEAHKKKGKSRAQTEKRRKYSKKMKFSS